MSNPDRPCSEALQWISEWNKGEQYRKEAVRKREWPYEDGKLPPGDKIEMAPMPGFRISCEHGHWEYDLSLHGKWRKLTEQEALGIFYGASL